MFSKFMSTIKISSTFMKNFSLNILKVGNNLSKLYHLLNILTKSWKIKQNDLHFFGSSALPL